MHSTRPNSLTLSGQSFKSRAARTCVHEREAISRRGSRAWRRRDATRLRQDSLNRGVMAIEELRKSAGGRAPSSSAPTSRRAYLYLDRSLVQPAPPPFGTGLPVADQLRAAIT